MKLKMTTLRNVAMAGIMLLFCTAASCGNNEVDAETEETEQSGTFKLDGVDYKGKSSVETFVNGNYSILCEQDDPYKFIQITFHSKAEAEKGGTFKLGDYGLDIPSGEANIGVQGLTFDPDGSYTITVSGKKITLSNVKLKQTGGGGKSASIQSANISF